MSGNRAIITGFDAANRLLVTQVLIIVGEDLDLTIGYAHAFFESTWDLINHVWVDSTIATPGPLYFSSKFLDLSPTGVIATGAQMGCLSC